MEAAAPDRSPRELVEAAYRAEQASDDVAKSLSDIPVGYDRIGLEWWSALLCRAVPFAEVVRFTPVDPDGLDRGHMRVLLEYNQAGCEAGLPASVFCKDSQRLGVRVFNALCDTVRPEINFYEELKPLLDLNTPTALHAAYHPETHNSLLVMDDLDLTGARFCTPDVYIDRAMIEKQLETLANLHGSFYGRTASDPTVSGLRTFHDNSKLYDHAIDLAGTTEKGFLASEHLVPRRLWVRAKQIWPATLDVLRFHGANPVTLTHNDAHIKNWYIDGTSGMGLADWQCIARAHWSHDVAFAISTSLTIEDRRLWERELLEFYRDRLNAYGGPRLDAAESFDAYRINLLIALCWWTPCVKHDQGFSYHPEHDIIETIRRTATAIDDLDALPH